MIENFLVGHFQKWIWPIWSLDSKIECYLKNGQMKLTNFFHVGTNLYKLKSCLKIFGVGMVKNGCGQSGDGSLKLTVSEEWTDGINWFVLCWYKFIQIKSCLKIFWLCMVKNECGQSGHETLKFTVSQKWMDGINWFFECCYIFRKAKSWFNNFWVGIVKNGHGLLVHETLKSAVS